MATVMDPRGTLHGRHQATLFHDVLIVDDDHGARMPPSDVFDPSRDESEGKLLVPSMSQSCTVDPAAEKIVLLDANFHGHEAADDLSSRTINSDPIHSKTWDEGGRFRDRFGGLSPLGTLDIMRESSRILRHNSDLFTTLTAALIVPISVVILTHVLVTRPIIDWVERRFEVAVFDLTIVAVVQSRYTKFIFVKLAEFLVTSVLCIPLAITLAALSKAGIVYTVASTYAGLKVSFLEVMQSVMPRLWLPLVITYTCSCGIFLATGIALMLCLGVVHGLFASLHPSSAVMLFYVSLLGIAFCGIFFYLKIIFNLANVICVLENSYGFEAFERSFLILQGRFRVASCSYFITCLCGGFVTFLFEYRVNGRNDYTKYNSSGTWEGPLLVLMHSFVYLYDDIMTTVFYFTYSSSSSLVDFRDRSRVSQGTIAMGL